MCFDAHTHTYTEPVSWSTKIYLLRHALKCCDSDECEPDSVSLLLPPDNFILTAISWRSCHQASSTVSSPWGLRTYKFLLNQKWKIFTHYQEQHTHTLSHTHHIMFLVSNMPTDMNSSAAIATSVSLTVSLSSSQQRTSSWKQCAAVAATRRLQRPQFLVVYIHINSC